MRNAMSSDRRGVLLIVVLVLVLLMSVAAYGFLLSMQTVNIAARFSGDRLTAEQAAFSGIELVSAVLELPRSQRGESGDIANNPDLFGGVPLMDDREVASDEDGPRFAVVMSGLAIDQPTGPAYGVVDESARLHLGKLVEWDRYRPDTGKQALVRLPGMTGDVADAILDWVDSDSQPRFEGAEADAYVELGTGVSPRNGNPRDLEELLLVRGVDSSRLFGSIAGSRGGSGLATDMELAPWSQYLTVYSAERNESRDGMPRIFLNGQQLDVLHQRLVERMPAAWANFIVLYRQFSPGGPTKESMAPEQITVDFTRPPAHFIRSPLDLVGVTLSVPHQGKTVSVSSPFSSDLLVMKSQLPELVDQVTTTPATVIEGRINVNLAPREVLMAVPGIDEGLAERILAARSMGGDTGTARDAPTWLLTEGLVDLATMRRLLRYINAGGDVFRGEYWGWGHSGTQTPNYRCEAVIDATQKVARQVYFRELIGKPQWTMEEPPGP